MGRKRKNKPKRPTAAPGTDVRDGKAPSAAVTPPLATRRNTIATTALLLLLAVIVAVILGVLESVKTTVLENCSGCFTPARGAVVSPSATRGGTAYP